MAENFKKYATWVLLFFIAIVAVWWCSNPAWWPIRVVHLDHQLTHIPQQTIEKIVDADVRHAGWLRLHTRRLSKQIRQLPWVDSVQIARRWPDGVSIQVHERNAFGRFGSDKLIDAKGVVFQPKQLSDQNKTLPMFKVDARANPAKALARFKQIQALVQPLAWTLVFYQREADGRETLKTHDKLEVILCDDVSLFQLGRLIGLYPTVFHGEKLRSVNLCYPHAFAVVQ